MHSHQIYFHVASSEEFVVSSVEAKFGQTSWLVIRAKSLVDVSFKGDFFFSDCTLLLLGLISLQKRL